MVDPLYMSLLAGNVQVDAKNMYEMGPILDTVARTCLDEGCTPIVAHHFVKKREDPYGPAVLEDLAFSGVGQFVRQWMLLARRERYDPETGVHKLESGTNRGLRGFPSSRLGGGPQAGIPTPEGRP
jgi:hypothetical protein